MIADLLLAQKTSSPPSFADLVLLIRTEEDKKVAKDNRMRKHLGLHKQSSNVPKLRTAAHRLTACSCAAPEGEISETELLKKQIDEMQAQVAVMQTTTPRKTKPNCSDAAVLTQIADIQAQAANMKAVAHETKNDSPEVAEIKTLKHQLAKLQAQVSTPQAQSHQAVMSTRSREGPTKVQHQPVSRKVSGQSSSGEPTTNRPRPWKRFCCGEDTLQLTESEPNPLLVQEKRQLLKEKQQQWDHQNSITGTQQLNC